METGFQILTNQFLKEREFSTRLSPKTIIGYREFFHLFQKLMPELTSIQFLNTELITEFFWRLEKRERIVGRNTIKVGVKRSTVLTYWSRLNPFCEWLLQNKYINSNPLRRIRVPSEKYQDYCALPDENIRKLYAAVSLHSKSSLALKRDTAMLSILVFCGLRSNEFLSIDIVDIDFDRQLLTVKSCTSKSKLNRFIPMHPTLIFHTYLHIIQIMLVQCH